MTKSNKSFKTIIKNFFEKIFHTLRYSKMYVERGTKDYVHSHRRVFLFSLLGLISPLGRRIKTPL